MSVRTQVWLWLAQRISGGALAIFVSVHLLTMIVAVQGGLSAAEISTRLHGSVPWLAFYMAFVAAAAVHAPIGIRNMLAELTPMRMLTVDIISVGFALALLSLGSRAALAMFTG